MTVKGVGAAMVRQWGDDGANGAAGSLGRQTSPFLVCLFVGKEWRDGDGRGYGW